MSPSPAEPKLSTARDVTCDDDNLLVALDDGRTIAVPPAWFARLFPATPYFRCIGSSTR